MLIGVVPVIVAVRAGLSLWPFKQLVRILRATAERLPGSEGASPDRIHRIAWAVNAAGSRLLGSKPCLTQALVVQFLLWRHEVETELRIGVDKDGDGKLLAHAWVVWEGEVIIGGRLSEVKYRKLPNLQDKLA